MDKVYKLTINKLEFDVYIENENNVVSLCVENEKYNITARSYLYGKTATKQDLELFDNLIYALENGKATLKLNKHCSEIIFTANFGTISGKPAIFERTLDDDHCDIKETLAKKKYDELLEKYNALLACHTCQK